MSLPQCTSAGFIVLDSTVNNLAPQPLTRPVVLYDAECGLCDRSVRFILRHDAAGIFRFAALGSPTAELLAPGAGSGTAARSLVLIDADGVYLRSEAVLKIAARLSRPWRWAIVFRHLPLGLRDRMYNFVATHRRRWFGGVEACELPNPAWRERFLDEPRRP